MACGVGAGAPRWWVWTATGAIVVVLAAVAVRLRAVLLAGLVVAGDGAVTDFIALLHWPTFNIADMAITAGVVWLGAAAAIADTRPGSGVRRIGRK